MQVPASRLPGGIEAGEAIGTAADVSADTAHAVMLGRSYRNELVHRIDAQEVATDIGDVAEVGLYVFLAQVANIQPEVGSVGRFDAVALARVVSHAPADHVPGGELLLLWLVVEHEAVLVFVQ